MKSCLYQKWGKYSLLIEPKKKRKFIIHVLSSTLKEEKIILNTLKNIHITYTKIKGFQFMLFIGDKQKHVRNFQQFTKMIIIKADIVSHEPHIE